MEQGIVSHTDNILIQIVSVITGDVNIWSPVLIAWACGFMYTRYLNGVNMKRKSDREWRVYRCNFVIASLVYFIANLGGAPILGLVQQSMFAGAIAVLLPAAWFWWQTKKGK